MTGKKGENMKEKTYVEDIDRSMYDFRNEDADAYRLNEGLSEEIVLQISKEKNDPEWMKELRLKSLKLYNEMDLPDWGPSLKDLDMDHIATYVRKNAKLADNWDDVPAEVKDTFE